MLITTHVIVLSKLKYGDNDLIIKCYSKEFGIISFLQRNILNSKRGKVKKGYFESLSQLQLQILYKPKRSLQVIKEVKASHLYSSLHTHVLKSSIVIFLSELLTGVLREEEINMPLYQYLETTLLWLDNHEDYANFHLLFLLRLTKYLGFYPDELNSNFNYFNLVEGKFVSTPSDIHSISGENLGILKQLLGTGFDAINILKLNSRQRQSFLQMILHYYQIHLGNFKPPKSLDVLNQVFRH